MKNRLLLFVLILWISTASLKAFSFDLTLSVGGDSLQIPDGSYALLVADTGADGFEAVFNSDLLEGATAMAADMLLGDDDLIVFTSNMGIDLVEFAGSGTNGFNFNTHVFETSDYTAAVWSEGSPLGLFWFPAGSSSTGDSFSFYRSNMFTEGVTIAFTTPGGGVESIVDLSENIGGTTASFISGYPSGNPAEGGFTGTIAAVPEPSDFAFWMMGGLALLLFRKSIVARAVRRG